MSGKSGRLATLSVETSPGSNTWTVVGGMTTNALTQADPMVDVTNKGSNGDRELLAGAGVRTVQITGTAVYEDDTGYEIVAAAVAARTNLNYQFSMPLASGTRTYTGVFQVTSLSHTSPHNGAITFTITLESSGAITIA